MTNLVQITEFKGHSVISLSMDRGLRFAFGRAKAITILKNIYNIKKFLLSVGYDFDKEHGGEG
jgi:hypothetical protein